MHRICEGQAGATPCTLRALNLRSLQDVKPIATDDDPAHVVRAKRTCIGAAAHSCRVVQEQKVAVAQLQRRGAALDQQPVNRG